MAKIYNEFVLKTKLSSFRSVSQVMSDKKLLFFQRSSATLDLASAHGIVFTGVA